MRRLVVNLFVISLVFILSVCLLPQQATAATLEYYTYEVSDGEATITDVDTAINGAVTIPSTLDGYPVTCIGDYAFYDCYNLTSITIPDSVTSIGDSVFRCCSKLTGIWVNEGNRSYSSDDRGVLFNKDKTILIHAPCALSGSYTIPDSVINIDDYSFSDCSLTSITIPDGVTSIGEFTFRYCSSLASVTLGNSITNIGSYEFFYCSSLTSITIPESVISIGIYAFYECTSLSSVTYCGTEEQWNNISIDSSNIALKNAERTYHNWQDATCSVPKTCTICGGTDGKALEHNYISNFVAPTCIERGYTTYVCTDCNDSYIGDFTNTLDHNYIDGICDACGDLKILSSGLCGDNVNYILYETGQLVISGTGFMHNYSATTTPWYNQRTFISSVIVEDNITCIGNSAFSGCINLTSITIPNSVTSIGNYAFRNCSSLTEITIPASVSDINAYVLSGCTDLQTIYFKGNSSTTVTPLLANLTLTAYYPVGNTTWTETVMQSYGGNVTWISHEVIPEGLQYEIVDGEVKITKYTGNAANVVIPPTIEGFPVRIVGPKAFFDNCEKIVSITLPETVTHFEFDAFNGCHNLQDISIPDGLVSSLCSFNGPNSLQYSQYGNGLYLGNATNPYVLFVDVVDRSTITSCYLHTKTKCINIWAFSDCEILTEVVIPDGLIGVSDSAFQMCYSLESISFPDSVTHLGALIFMDCYNLKSVKLPAQLKIIPGGLFFACSSLNNIEIPFTVDVIEDRAFAQCSMLSSITLPQSLVRLEQYAFLNCDNLSEVLIPEKVNYIDPIAFRDCNNLRHIGVDENNAVYSSDEYGVLCNKEITEVILVPGKLSGCYEILDSVNAIGNYAFSDCSNLTDVIIPESVVSIGKYAFNGCVGLQNVYYAGTLEQWNAISIGDGNDPLLSATLTLNYIPPHDCKTCGDWVVTVQPTFTSNGERYIICSVCGATVTESIDMLVGKVAQWNITLEDDYAVNFYLQVSESIESTAKVRLTIGNDTMTYNVSALEKTEDGYFRLTASISAAQMNDFITVMVMNGREIGCNNTYSARQYCDTILTDSTYSRYHALVKEMLNYGAMAQIYFDYDTGYLANEGITGTATTEIPEIVDDLTVTDKISDLSFYGASLVYRDRIAVRYYFTGDVNGCSFTVNGNTYTPVAKDGMYYIEITDILPQNLDQQITLTVTDASGNTLTVTYGPMNYIVRMNQKDNDNLKNLLKALFNYHLAAKALQSA